MQRILSWIRNNPAEFSLISFFVGFVLWLFPIPNVSPYIFDFFDFIKHVSIFEHQEEGSRKNTSSAINILTYLGDTTGQTRCDRVLAFLQSTSIKEPLKIDDLLKVITGIPRDLYCRQETVIITLRKSNTALTALEAARILETLDNVARTTVLSDMLCYIERPIKENEKLLLLNMVDPPSLSPIKSSLDLSKKPSCEM